MKCIMIIQEPDGLYRVYWDLKYNDFVILTPSFKMSRNPGHVGLGDYDEKIRKCVDEARNGKIKFSE